MPIACRKADDPASLNPATHRGARCSEPGAVIAMYAIPATAPTTCAAWFTRPVRARPAKTLYARKPTAKSGAGIGTGNGRMKIDDVGATMIEANTTARMAPDAPRLP